jgi:hypothetical protein
MRLWIRQNRPNRIDRIDFDRIGRIGSILLRRQIAETPWAASPRRTYDRRPFVAEPKMAHTTKKEQPRPSQKARAAGNPSLEVCLSLALELIGPRSYVLCGEAARGVLEIWRRRKDRSTPNRSRAMQFDATQSDATAVRGDAVRCDAVRGDAVRCDEVRGDDPSTPRAAPCTRGARRTRRATRGRRAPRACAGPRPCRARARSPRDRSRRRASTPRGS